MFRLNKDSIYLHRQNEHTPSCRPCTLSRTADVDRISRRSSTARVVAETHEQLYSSLEIISHVMGAVSLSSVMQEACISVVDSRTVDIAVAQR